MTVEQLAEETHERSPFRGIQQVVAPARPLRVLHLVDSLRPGGAEQLLLTTVRGLDPKWFSSSVAALFPPFDLRADLERLGVPVHGLSLRSALDWRRGIIGLARLLHRRRVDVLHTHLRFSNVYGRIAAALARTPVTVTSLHHLDYSHWPPSGWLQRLWKLGDKLTARLVNDAFIAVSQAVREDYARHFNLSEIAVIYNYLMVDEFTSRPRSRALAKRGEFHWTDEAFVLTNVARLAPEKGQQHLVQAMAEIVSAIPEARLLLAGDGPAGPSLRSLTCSLGLEGHVWFAGNRRDISELLGMSDLFLFPSVAEGLGIALMEAMAAGLPVIASRVDGILEIVRHGVDGLLVEPGKPTEIAEAVIRLHKDPELGQRLGREAQQTAVRRFNARAAIKQIEALYTRLCSNAAPGAQTGERR